MCCLYLSGRTRLDVFREQLAALGLEETAEVRKVLSQVPIKFTALMRAFAADGVSSSADFVAGGRASKVRHTALWPVHTAHIVSCFADAAPVHVWR
jgi:hypothetical protein